jgi:hypothetical protein
LRRAAYSVPVTEASLAEVGYCIHVAHRLRCISDELLGELEKEINGVGAPLGGLARSTKADLTLPAVVQSQLVWLSGSQRDRPSCPSCLSCPSCRRSPG